MALHPVNNQRNSLPAGSQQSAPRLMSGEGQRQAVSASRQAADQRQLADGQRRISGASSRPVSASGRGKHSANASTGRGRHGKGRQRNFASTLTACCVVLAVGLVGFLGLSEPVGMLQNEADAQNAVVTQVGQEVTIQDDATPMAGPAARELSDDELQQVADELLALVNDNRNDSGRNDLAESDALAKTAAVRADELPDAWSHTRPNGDDWSASLQEEGFAVGDIYAAENVAMTSIDSSFGYQDQDFAKLASTLYETMASHSDQQKNLLSRYYQYAGVGFSQVESDGRVTVYLCLHCCSESE